ncbi:MAG: hypothetical protein ACOH5I_12975 [Oligoflexus sp.]
MKFWQLTTLGFFFLVSAPLQAYTSVASARGSQQPRFSGSLVLHDIDYQSSNNDFAVDGDLLVFGYKTPVNPGFSFGLGLGLMLDGDLGTNQTIGDGSGFRFFVDGDFEVHRSNNNRFVGTFALVHDRFKFEQGADLEFTVTEIKFGGLMIHRMQNLALYGGLELVLYSDGSLENNNFSTDIERDDRLNVRLGSSFALAPTVDLRLDLFLIGEQTLLFGADFQL